MNADPWDDIGRAMTRQQKRYAALKRRDAELPKLREELREAIQTLSNARRSEVWELVNKMLALYDSPSQGSRPDRSTP